MQLQLADLIVVIPVLFVSISLHEAMHAFAAYWLGDDTAKLEGRLTLNPLKHIDPFTTFVIPVLMITFGLPPLLAAKPVPFNPSRVRYEEFGAALVGVAGPLTNLAIATIAALLLRTLNMSTEVFNVIAIFCVINVALFVFNMLPIPPLDGSRLLYAFAPESVQRVLYKIESYGLVVVFLIVVLFMSFLGPLLTFLNQAVLKFLLGPVY